MNRRKFFSFLAPLGLIIMLPKSTKAQKVQRQKYIMSEEYDQRTIQEAFDNISRRLQEGGL